MEEEIALQALWSCSKIRSAWSSSEWTGCQNISPLDFKELLSWILKNRGTLRVLCNGDVGLVEPTESGSAQQALLPIGPN